MFERDNHSSLLPQRRHVNWRRKEALLLSSNNSFKFWTLLVSLEWKKKIIFFSMSTHSGMAEFLKRSMTSQSQKQPSPLPPNGKFSFNVITKPYKAVMDYQHRSARRDIWLALMRNNSWQGKRTGQGECQKVVTLLGWRRTESEKQGRDWGGWSVLGCLNLEISTKFSAISQLQVKISGYFSAINFVDLVSATSQRAL